MKAIQIPEPGSVRLIDLPEPTPAAGEVLLATQVAGYCGTDLSTFRGVNPLMAYPRVPGHEIGAKVVAAGDGVTGWSAGRDVLVFPYTECGACSACLAGRPNCCKHNQTLGVQREGAMSELFTLPAEKLIEADGLSQRELALVEPLTVGAHAAARGEGSRGDTVLVFGCGAIGIGAIAGAAFRGGRVIAVDIDDAKLELARKCGAAECINSASDDLSARVMELTDGHGPSVVIEAVGLPQTFLASIDLVAFAGRVVYIGYAKAPVEYETKFFVMKELDVRGSRNALAADFRQVIAMLQSGGLPTDEIVTRTVGIDDACQALSDWSENPAAVTKIHIQFA
ncbi:MAG: zinc-binding alcohol dehydrogenase family protein [Planctomycetota bacterium]